MHARSRRREGRERARAQLDDEDDYGEGCSYTTALAASVASRSITRDHAPAAHAGARTREPGLDSNSTLPCTCSSTRIYTPARRRARGSRASATLTATTMVVATAAHGVHASPVDPKGKRREDAREGKEGPHYAASVQWSLSAHAVDALAAPDALLDSDQGLSFHQQQARSGLERRSKDGTQQQQEQHQRRRDTWRSNTPEGVPSYYELVDGQWVPTRDWALNGKAGGPPESESASNNGESDENSYVAHEGSQQSSAEHSNNVSHHASSGTSTTIGWAKSTNVVFGVDINTSDREEESVTTSTTSSHIATRTGLPTITSTSSTATGTSTATTRSSTPGQVYDFSRDVPNGWVSDGRTAAYAVPVIIGLSIFLACLIFSLIIVLLRMAKSRRRRMKAHQNGKLKLSEEGVVPRHSRPASPGGSSIAAGSDNGSDNSSILRRRRHNRTANGDSDSIEEEKQHSRKRIGRKWAPGISGGLRKRRTKIAELFRRNEEEKVVVIAEHGETENTAPATEQEMQPLDNRTSANEASSTELARSGSALSATSGYSAPLDRLSRQPSTNSITPSARGRPSISRTQSLRINSSVSSDAEPTEAQSARSSRPRSRSSVDMNDHHAVPVPAVGPPAYMQPASPAYTRATPASFSDDGSRPSTANTALTNSLRAGGAVAAAGYLSAVSTPGLAPSIDEKRGLLSGPADAGPAASGSSDAFREHRRYEHLYASREGEAARVEQVTGAASSSSSRQTQADLDARVREEEESRRRELQQAMAGHVAVSDKEVLGRLRLAASAPDAHEGNVTATPSQGTSTASSFLHASAPYFDDAEEDDIPENLQTEPCQPESAAHPTSSLLPRPPQAARASALDRLPCIDEKTRLRQLEDEQAARAFGMHGEIPSAPPSIAHDTASAPPSSAPSAPSFEFDGPTAPPPSAPSAPPYLPDIDVTEASAPAEDDEPAAELPEQHTRRYEEGVV